MVTHSNDACHFDAGPLLLAPVFAAASVAAQVWAAREAGWRPPQEVDSRSSTPGITSKSVVVTSTDHNLPSTESSYMHLHYMTYMTLPQNKTETPGTLEKVGVLLSLLLYSLTVSFPKTLGTKS